MLNDEQKQQIQSIYSRWIEVNDFKPRRSQREMIAAVAKMLGSIPLDGDSRRTSDDYQHLLLVEAGTGTGKTMGYLIPALVMARCLEKKLVVATATINLQAQLVNKDLPNLAEVFDAQQMAFSYELGKGRGRYLCLSKVQRALDGAAQTEPALFPDEEARLNQHELEALREYRRLYESFIDGDPLGWDGDRDNYPGELDDKHFFHAAADAVSCTGRRCDNFLKCALFKARDRVKQADVIVANHDLVLTDAVMGGGLLPDPQETIYVFDEAHHVPNKCRERTTLSLSVSAEQNNLSRATKLMRRLKSIAALPADELGKIEKQILSVDEAMSTLLPDLLELLDQLFHNTDSVELSVYRFPHGHIGDTLAARSRDLANCSSIKASYWGKLERLVDGYRPLLSGAELSHLEGLQVQISQFRESSSNACDVFTDYAGSVDSAVGESDQVASLPRARWVDRSEYDGFQLKSAPLVAGAMLSALLWEPCFAAVLTSATLTATRGIAEFADSIGCDQSAAFSQLEGAIDYSRGELHIPQMDSEPGNVSAHTQEVIRLLPELLPPNVGSLVLFSSWRQMEDVYEATKCALPFEPLLQGALSKNELIRRHKLAVDKGSTSAIFGLASFSEGIDLSGDYCRQLIIAKLPFAAPDSPFEEALAEWVESQGDNAFFRVSLPQAAMRLRQACGRLLRSEADEGRISLLDRRVVTRRYGKELLAALPAYSRFFE